MILIIYIVNIVENVSKQIYYTKNKKKKLIYFVDLTGRT